MPNRTLYIKTDIWELFKDETDKSDLINALLTTHYGKTNDRPFPKLINKVLNEVEKEYKLSTCKHGNVGLCKFGCK